MSDYTRFCASLSITTQAAAQAEAIYQEYLSTLVDDCGEDPGFKIDIEDGKLVIEDYDRHGRPDQVEEYILKLASRVSLEGHFVMHWAETSDRSRFDSFAGGLLVIDLKARQTVINKSTHGILEDLCRDNAEMDTSTSVSL